MKKLCVQVNLLVVVKDEEVRVNPEENSMAVWAADNEFEGLKMTEGMRTLVERASVQIVNQEKLAGKPEPFTWEARRKQALILCLPFQMSWVLLHIHARLYSKWLASCETLSSQCKTVESTDH